MKQIIKVKMSSLILQFVKTEYVVLLLLMRYITTSIFDKVNEHNYKQLEINWN